MPEPMHPLLAESRRQLESDLARLQDSLDETLGWAGKGKVPATVLLGLAAGFMVARNFRQRAKKRRELKNLGASKRR